MPPAFLLFGAATAAGHSHHTNWPARILAVVLMVVASLLLFWRRRGGRIRK
jgi:hypothetical protein